MDLTFNISNLLGANPDYRRTKVWLETNIPDDVIVDSGGNEIRLGTVTASVGQDGTGVFEGVIETNALTNPTNWQYQAHVDYPDAHAPKGRASWASGWFSLNVVDGLPLSVDLSDVAAEVYVPPTYSSTLMAELDAHAAALQTPMDTAVAQAEAARDAAVDISGISTSDGVITAIDANAASAFRVQQDARLSATFVPVITPEKHGAVGDGTANDTAAVLAAFAEATALRRAVIGGTVFEPRATVRLRGRYKLTTLASQIVASCNIDGAEGALIAPATYAGTVLLVGHETSGNLLQAATMTLPSITKSGATTLPAGSVGVKVQNLHDSDIFGRRIDYFETAWLITGLGQGTVYNRINLGRVDLCKVSYKLAPSTGGWVNSNTFTGGGVTQSANTLDGTGIRRSGWRHLVIDGSAGAGTVNSNTFDAISFEGDLSEFYFDIKHASNNTWLGANRFEQGTAARAVTLASDTFTDTAHGLAVGDMVIFTANTALAGRMKRSEAYYVSAVPTADTFKVAETRGGASYTFASNGSGLVYYVPPRIKIDGTGGATYANDIKSGYYSFPGPLDIREVNAAHSNPVGPSLPRRDTAMPGRNRIINGDFRVNQRAYTSGTSLAIGAFGFDRWKSNQAATTLTFTSAPQGQLVVLDGYIQQVIERGDIPAGTYTLSWDGNATARVYNSGASAPTLAFGPITVDLDGTADVVVEFFGSAQTLGRVQLELGRVATAFEQDSIAIQLAKCKRFFQRLGTGTSGREPVGMGIGSATTAGFATRVLSREMRTTPTLTVTSAATFRINVGGTLVNPTAISLDGTSTGRGVRLSISTASGLTAGGGFYLDTGDGYLDFSAEL